MSLVWKKSDLASLNEKPAQPMTTFMEGYGGFGNSQEAHFSKNGLIWMNMFGGMLAYPHIRGGGDLGPDWHSEGMKESRQNVFDDFEAAAQYLIDKKYTDSGHICAQGGSNGGTVMAVVANQRPDLFRLIKIKVAVTDMVRFPKFTNGKAWNPEYGNPETIEQGAGDYLMKYSPYHNVKEQKYPMLLVTTGTHDDRVSPLHSYKLAAELQYKAGQISDEPILLSVEKNVGHSGSDL